MSEGFGQNIIDSAEFKAIKEIDQVSETENIETIGQIIDRIHQINKSMKGFDLVIESKTFRELAGLTGVSMPRLNDRIISSIRVLMKATATTHENSYKTIVNILKKLFEWDENNQEYINTILLDLKHYTKIRKEKELIQFTQKLLDKYKFNSILFNKFEEHNKENSDSEISKIKNKFFLTIAFISKIGPLISIYESIKNEKNQTKANQDATLGILTLVMQYINLKEIYITDLIPNLIRALARQTGIDEDTSLKMRTNELLEISKKDKVGQLIIELAAHISKKNREILSHSRVGQYIWMILEDAKFWENATYMPQLGMLSNIAKGGNKDIMVKKDLNKLSDNAGEIANLLNT